MPDPNQPYQQSPFDSPLAQILIPLASAAISAYSPRYGAAGVQGGLGALGAMQQHSMNSMHMQDLEQRRRQRETDTMRFQELIGSATGDQSSAPNGGNVPAATAALQQNVFEQTGEPPRPGTAIPRLDPMEAKAIQFQFSSGDRDGAARRLSEVLGREQKATQPRYHWNTITNEYGDQVESRINEDSGAQSQFLLGGSKPEKPPAPSVYGDYTNPDPAVSGRAKQYIKDSRAPEQPASAQLIFADDGRPYAFNPKTRGFEPVQIPGGSAAPSGPPPDAVGTNGSTATAPSGPPKPAGVPAAQGPPKFTNAKGKQSTSRRVDSVARAFDSLPIVKTVQKQAEAVAFVEKMDPNTTNPADDQGLIYSFAKAMDPDSVVREGEYATVQKYAQSWADKIGFDAKRIFSNTAFLTPQARENMRQTIRARYAAGKSQYDNVRQSYEAQINKRTGGSDGAEYLTDYGAGFPADAPAQAAPAGGGEPTATNPKTGEKVVFRNGAWQAP